MTTVSDLQQTLRELAGLLKSAGAKAAALDGLAAVGPALDKFAHLKVKEFADLLGRVDLSGSVIDQTGRKTGGRTKAPTVDPAAAADEAADLYGRAADRSLPDDRYLDLFDTLAKLDKNGLLAVADRIELQPAKSATKPKLLEAIRSRIEDRRGATLRRNMLDRPAAG